MTARLIFITIVAILIINFIIEALLDHLNAKHFNDKLPPELNDIYDSNEYGRSQAYKKARARFGTFSAISSLILTLAFLFVDGFAYVDQFARSFSDNPIIIALIFFGVIILGSDILTTPFSYYSTFVIEEKFGFNQTTKKTFFLDKLKGWVLGAVLGGGLLSLVIWFYQRTGDYFWIYAWVLITIFTVFMNMFYGRLIVPLFNKQHALADSPLRQKIEAYAQKVGFVLDNIFIIDGSKRSTKANAYFSGFGKEKRITLFDTLVNDLEEKEIVAVLAHEVGHYKNKHIIYNLLISISTTGFTLWLLSVFIDNPQLAEALGTSKPSFHIGLIAFGLLYTPISVLTGLFMNKLSRKFEYQADNFAKDTYDAQYLISSLKKLSAKSLSNLTPHSLYVFFHYAHPSLLQRIKNLEKD